MPSLEKPCLLLPHGSARSNVYFCIPVDPGLATKSPVIETLMEFDGLVEMPEGISLDDFEAWAATATQDPSDLAFEELSLALQVSDKLSAHNSTQLAKALADKLKAADWRSDTAKEAISSALLRLGKNMQHLVFRKAGRLSAPDILSWPTLLQQAYSDLWVTPEQGEPCTLTLTEKHPPATVLGFLDLLSRTDPALPGLSRLSILGAIPSAEAANLLRFVLLHHPKLAALCMPRLSFAPCSPSPPAATIFRTLPQLTGITSLSLSAPCVPTSLSEADSGAATESVQAMAAAISALPQLAGFHLTSMATSPAPHDDTKSTPRRHGAAAGMPPAPKRRRIAACLGSIGRGPTPPSLDLIIASLSKAPSLTSLKFDIPSATLGRPLPCSGIRGPFRTLQELKIKGSDRVDVGCDEGVPPGMEVLDTSGVRLPALTRLEYTNTSPGCCDDCGSLRRMLAAAAVHPALKAVDLYLGGLPGFTGGFELRVYVGSAEKIVAVRCERGMTEEVAKVLQCDLHSLAASAHELGFRIVSREGMRPLEGVEHVAAALPPLATLTSLRTLDINMDLQARDINQQSQALCHAILAQPLQPLRLLTSLDLDMSAQLCTPMGMVAKQLQGMPQLQMLYLDDVKHEGAHEFQACFAPLTALTFFSVRVRPVTADLVRAWARAACAMPHLDRCFLISCDSPDLNPAADTHYYADADWVQGLLELPSRGTFIIRCCNEETPEGELDAVRQQLVDRGAHVGDFCDHISFDNGS